MKEAEEGWAYYLLELPATKQHGERWWEYAIPTVERERSSAHKAALRKLERLAIKHGGKVQISRLRKKF